MTSQRSRRAGDPRDETPGHPGDEVPGRLLSRPRAPRRIGVAWAKAREQGGAEWATVALGEESMSARGVAVAARPVPYRIDYALWTGPGFVTTRLRVAVEADGWRRALDLRRGEDGRWTAAARSAGREPAIRRRPLPPPGADAAVLAALDGALDCDLGWSPLTNTMPVLRHGLLEPSPPRDLVMAWVSVPDLAVRASGQRYTFLRPEDRAALVRYESGTFAADLRFDADGLVVDYPGLARRL